MAPGDISQHYHFTTKPPTEREESCIMGNVLTFSFSLPPAPSPLENNVVEEVIHPCNPNPCPSNHLCQVNRKGCLDELNCLPYLCVPGRTYSSWCCAHSAARLSFWTGVFVCFQAVNWAKPQSFWCSRTQVSRCPLAPVRLGATRYAAVVPVDVWRTVWRCPAWTPTSLAS